MDNKFYPHIFSPITIGGVTYKNRIFQAPATPHLLQRDEKYPTEAYIEYYAAKARGGTASVTVGGYDMGNAPEKPGWHSTYLLDRQYWRDWTRLTDAIHFYGAKASLELLAFFYYGYRQDGSPFIYSVDGTPGPDGSERPMLTQEAMQEIADRYADTAEAALNVGFDSILIHGGHGLVIFRFLSELFNHRTDEFGGSFENRARFPIMILDAIRKRVGRRLLIEYRISGDELAEVAGMDVSKSFRIDDCIHYLEMIQDKIDIAHISAGNMSIPGTEAIMHPTIFCKPAQNAWLARKVKESGKLHIHVLTLGAFQDPALIEETLATGGADLVAMARGTIADPEMPNKAFEGRGDEIIPCIKCFHCLDYTRINSSFGCSVNPEVGREVWLPAHIEPPRSKKNVVIIGGGPAGMQAAITAAQRGHQVTIYEKGPRLGGKLLFAEQMSFKYDLARFVHYQIHMIEKLGVRTVLNTEATPEQIEALHADVVFAAIGGYPFVPPIPGVRDEAGNLAKNVITAVDSFGYDPADLGQRLCFIGGGEVGCETALHYAMDLGKQVTVIEMLPKLSQETLYLPREPLVKNTEALCTTYTGARVTQITPDGVKFLDADGCEQFVVCDKILLSSGMRADSTGAEAFRTCAPVFDVLGDARLAKNVRTATRTAYDAAVRL